MAKKILVPVLPTERFYDAVVGAADLIAAEGGGLIVFLFTSVRRQPPDAEDPDGSGWPSRAEVEDQVDDEPPVDDLERWKQSQINGLEEARALLRERGIDERNVDYAFAEYSVPRAEAIAEEAAAGGYDAVVLPRDFVRDGSQNLEEEPPEEIPHALRDLGEVDVVVV